MLLAQQSIGQHQQGPHSIPVGATRSGFILLTFSRMLDRLAHIRPTVQRLDASCGERGLASGLMPLVLPDFYTDCAALRITSTTRSGCESIGT